jgi:hypothetical protein
VFGVALLRESERSSNMDIDTARHVVRQSFQIARELQGLLPFEGTL